MLTKQHRFASQILHPKERQVYKTHMCGLCHALGDGYGLLSRLLTSHEMILLNMLTNAQRETDLKMVMRRCPLNPTRHVQTNQDEASAFAAAAAIELARVSVLDDVQDSKGFNITAQILRLLIGNAHQTAVRTLEKLNFDASTFQHLTENQTQAENTSEVDPTAPTAMTSASLFAMTARLANSPENETPLAAIGASYGAYLYLMDAYRDYPEDMAKGTFNPLRPYTHFNESRFELTHDGLRWLLARFETIRAEIQTHWQQVKTVRYRDSLEYLLIKPLNTIIADLNLRLQNVQPIQFQKRTMGDVLKAALFIFPAATAGMGLLAANNDMDFEPVIDGKKRKRRKTMSEDTSGDDGFETSFCGSTPCYCDPTAVECCDCLCNAESWFDHRTGLCSADDATHCLHCVSSGDSNCDIGNVNCCDNCDVGGCDCNT